MTVKQKQKQKVQYRPTSISPPFFSLLHFVLLSSPPPSTSCHKGKQKWLRVSEVCVCSVCERERE